MATRKPTTKTDKLKQTEYLHRMDWKLWMLMNMVRTMGEDNGYIFKFNEESN
jgi:hypothetical protein